MFSKISMLLVVFLSGVAATGCTSMNGLVTQNTDPWSGASSQYWSSTPSNYHYNQSKSSHYNSDSSINKKTRGEIIADGIVEEIDFLFADVYKTHFADSDFDVSYTTTSNGMEIDMEWSSPTAFFPLGKYDLREIAYHSRGEGLAFVDIVSQGMRKMSANLKQAGARYRIKCTFFGQADGVPITKRLVYQGEYGTVSMSRNITKLNGVSHNFYIRPGQSLSNTQLAALRAYSLSSYMHKLALDVSFEDGYEISVVAHKGTRFRTAKVTIEILE